jgi:hypothetical protein
MVEEDKRAATDILLSIENKLNTLEKRIQNSEFLLKTLLGRTNKIPSTPQVSNLISSEEVINKDNFENRLKTNKFSEIAAKQGIDIDNLSNIQSIESGSDMVEASVRGVSRGQRGSKSKGPKSSVSQILNYGNDVLFLANVEVLDVNNELVSQTRTNNKGRWLLSLAPGDYQIHVTKRYSPDSGKKSIDKAYQISVPPSDKPLELDPFVIDMG